ALGRLETERIDVLRLAEQDADHEYPIEQPALLRFAHERDPVAAEERDVQRLGILGEDGTHLDARIDLAERGPALLHHLHVRLELLHAIAARLPGALAVLAVGTARRPLRVHQLAGRLGEPPPISR